MQRSETASFHFTTAGEPHAIRRVEILRAYPEIGKLFGNDPRVALVTLGVVAGQIAIAAAVAKTYASWGSARGLLLVALAFFVGAILNHWAAMTVHECSHALVFRRKSWNRWLALFANIPFVFPMAMSFLRYHMGHHAKLGVFGEDTDLPHAREVLAVGASRPRKFFWLLFNFAFYSGRAFTFMKPLDRWETFNIVWQVAWSAAIVAAFGWTALGYLVLSTIFGMSVHPVSAHFIHEHYGFENGQETYSYYGPLNKVAFNVGYHNEHHDFMQVPGFRLPELRAIASEHYDPLVSHDSWTGVLVEFVRRRDLTLADRIVRTRADFDSGRKALRNRKAK